MWLLLLPTIGDVTVSCETTIVSRDPIWLLAVEAVEGAFHDADVLGNRTPTMEGMGGFTRGEIDVDGAPNDAIHAAWRVLGFVVRDRAGSVAYAYRFDYGTIHIERRCFVENGHVLTTVILTGELGKRRVREIRLTLEATEHGHETRIDLGLSATVASRRNSPLARVVIRRIACRELAARLADIETTARSAVAAGRGRIDAVVGRFIEHYGVAP